MVKKQKFSLKISKERFKITVAEDSIDMESRTNVESNYSSDTDIRIDSMYQQSIEEVLLLSVARERLHRAVREGDVENVRKMLTNYKDWFNEASDDPLLRLEDDESQSKRRRFCYISSLIDEADMNIYDQPLIHYAMLQETLRTQCTADEIFTRLALRDEYKYDLVIPSTDISGQKFYKCDAKSVEPLRIIYGSHVTEHGLNALHVAAKHGQVEIMRMLLDHKVDVNSKDVNGNTALHHATGAGRLGTVIYINLEYDNDGIETVYADAENMYFIPEDTPYSHIENSNVLKLLIKYGASVTEQNNKGNTALHVAAALGHVTIAKLLLEHNASAVTADELQDTAARSAAERDHRKTEQQDSEESDSTEDTVLISNKFLLELKNKEGQTALLHAASKGCLVGVKFLLNKKLCIQF